MGAVEYKVICRQEARDAAEEDERVIKREISDVGYEGLQKQKKAPGDD
jgi:hypothetical protein